MLSGIDCFVERVRTGSSPCNYSESSLRLIFLLVTRCVEIDKGMLPETLEHIRKDFGEQAERLAKEFWHDRFGQFCQYEES